MKFLRLAELYSKLESTSSSLEKTDILSEFLKDVPKEELSIVTNFVTGNPFPSWRQVELGIATQLMIDAISRATGASKLHINDEWREHGDLGLVAAHFIENRRQSTLFSKNLKVLQLYHSLERMTALSGKGSQDLKVTLVSEMISNSTGLEATYLVRMVLGQMRIGVGEGVIRNAISQTFEIEKEIVERAFNILNDYGQIAEIAKESGEKGLKNVKIKLFIPLRVMLAQKVGSIEEAFERVANEDGNLVAEFKYDGMRVQIHKKGDEIRLFTRRMENITEQFPDVVQAVKNNVVPKDCILDSEIVAYDPESGKRVPFQELSKRIKRKYDIYQMTESIPVRIDLFDVFYIDDDNLIDLPYKNRWEKLQGVLLKSNKTISFVEHLETNSKKKVKSFYKKALKHREEGLMLKNLEAPYQPGSRVGTWVKMKPVMETLDLVIVGAEWGEGKRSNWLSSFVLACKGSQNGEFLAVGKMATGLTEGQFSQMTELLKDSIIAQNGRQVLINPHVVVEVAYGEIQKSPTYESGFALRFPRLVQLRDDLSIDEIDSVDKVGYLYCGQ